MSVERLDAATIAALPAATAPGIEGTGELAADVFAFTPHGTTFAVPVAVEIAHTGNGNVVLRLDDERDRTWELVPATTFASGVARFEITSFSIYAVAAAKRECQRRACNTLPAAVQCGKVDDGCGGKIDVHADCGLTSCDCGADNRCRPCVSTFTCAATTAACGVEVDNCGRSHDVLAECSNKPGCGAKGTCTPLNLCGSCTPYATCTEALAADGKGDTCNAAVPNGCGGIMDCATSVCPGGQACVSAGGQRQCKTACTTAKDCPSAGSSTCISPGDCPNGVPCNSPGVLSAVFSVCDQGYCAGVQTNISCMNDDGDATPCANGNCQN